MRNCTLLYAIGLCLALGAADACAAEATPGGAMKKTKHLFILITIAVPPVLTQQHASGSDTHPRI